ncbi:unnamed protein product [Calypogeia fissa]
MSGWRPDSPVELADGTFCCEAHHLVICGVCCCDYSFMQEVDSDVDDILDEKEEEEESSDTDSDSSQAEFLFTDSGQIDFAAVMRFMPPNSDDTPEKLFTEARDHTDHSRDAPADDQDEEQKPIDFTPVARFVPPNSDNTPEKLFTLRNTIHNPVNNGFISRFVRNANNVNKRQILIYTDGACSNNGRDGAVGGCAFVYRGVQLPTDDPSKANVSFRLEDRGPTGIVYPHTSNRAELRAVIAVLQFRYWSGEGYNELVIATDSEYVEKGATQWISGWVKRGWRTSLKKEVANRDLWELFFKEIQKFKECNYRPLRVMIWRIPRAWNKLADQAAKEAAARGEAQEKFCEIMGALC